MKPVVCGTSVRALLLLLAILTGICSFPSSAHALDAQDQAVIKALNLSQTMRSERYRNAFWKNGFHFYDCSWNQQPPRSGGPPVPTYLQRCFGVTATAIALYVFEDDASAQQFMKHPVRGNLFSDDYDPKLDCHRLAGGRYVIHVGSHLCPQRGEALLDLLEARVNAVISGDGEVYSPPAEDDGSNADASSDNPSGETPPPDDGTETTVSNLRDQLTHRPISGEAPPAGTTPLTNPNWNWDEIGKHFENMYQDGNVPSDGGQDGSPVDVPYSPANPTEWSETEVAVATGVGTTLGAGVAGLGAWLMLGQIGVGRREAFEDMGSLLRGQLPDDGFDAWKAKHQALGWKYVEENGIARFIPPDQAPVSPPIERPSQDGDVNPATGEIWSAEDGGWVGRNLYEQNQRRAQDIAAIEARSADAMQEYDAQTRAIGAEILDAPRQRTEIAKVFEERRKLDDAIEAIWRKDIQDGTLDETRKALLDHLQNKAEELSLQPDRTRALEELSTLGGVVEQQARAGFTPTYTYKDAVFDTGVQIGAAALDTVLTRGYASSAVGSSLAMRDAAREGKSLYEIAKAGVTAAAVDFGIGKSAEYLGHAVGAARTAWREAGEAAEEAAKVAERLGAAHNAVGDLAAQSERNLAKLEQNLVKDASGHPRARLEDVLEMQRTPHQVRNLKQTGAAELQEGFNNTLRSEVYKPHDKALVRQLKETCPDLADRKLVVHEFRTPGKASSGINTDRDFRVMFKNESGEWIEVPRERWEKNSQDIFADLTGYDASKCPKGLDTAQQKAWWAEQHGHTATDRTFREACPDYSDQLIDAATGERVRGTPRIEELKNIASGKAGVPESPLQLRDPGAIGQQFDEKIAGNLRRGDTFEAVAQAQKGVDTLDAVRKAYDVQGLKAGELPERLSDAMVLIRASNLPAKPNAHELAALQEGLENLGFSNLDEFGKSLAGQFDSLKLAK